MKNKICGLFVIFSIFFPNFTNAIEWKTPMGIPAPSFGIKESIDMYKMKAGENCQNSPFKCYDYGNGNGSEPYKLDSNLSPYTHYIDASHRNATDKDNKYGTVHKPRVTVPETAIKAGSIIYINGKIGTMNNIHVLGDVRKPIFIRGKSKDSMAIVETTDPNKSNVIKKGSMYLIIENIKFNGRGIRLSQNSHHIVLRNSEVTGQKLVKDNKARSVNSISADSKWVNGEYASDIVFYNNKIHDNGSKEGWPATCDCGIHGISIGDSSKNVWVIDNEIFRNSEDGIHVINFNKRGDPKNIYIARNKIYDNGENAIDIKQAENIIISQNDMHTYRPTVYSGGSDGAALVINNEAKKTPVNVWIIFNNIFNSTVGIRSQADKEYYIVGNNLYNIHKFGSNAPGAGYAMTFTSAKAMYIVGNTITDFDGGIQIANGVMYYIHNNLISGNPIEKYYHLALNKTKAVNYDLKNNLVYSRKGESIRNVNKFPCKNCILSVDPKLSQNKISESSIAIDKGAETDVYEKFYKLYGIRIDKDIKGENRKMGSKIDIGAYELTK